ncbi:MAG: phospho-sugar mutase [Lachnospiraceae bacterium]|nr:phospho-sugar mutase [Lachnospiraceae bacterium]
MNYKEKYTQWCENPAFDEKTKQELLAISNNEKEIEDRFYKDLEFGTAGLRGIIGAGTNRMNLYTVGKATQGLANYILKQNGKDKGVAIAFDSRRMSKEFSTYTALVLNSNGIKTFIFPDIRPIPELSFTIRELGCIAGVMITASHNPPEYNGYKVSWADGGQIVSPMDTEIITEVNSITDYSTIKAMDLEEAKQKGLYNVISTELDDKYIATIKKYVLNADTIKKEAGNIKIVYTPLHGAGHMLSTRILKELGFTNVFIVEPQAIPDGNFPTVEYPNPEDPKAFKLALELAKEKDADLILATDPDADRLGIYVKDSKTDEYIQFNGNMTANLLCEYEISQQKEKNMLPANSAVIKSIVSSNLTDAITKYYNIPIFEVLTGFKNIAKLMLEFEKTSSHKCIYSYEESYGCTLGTHSRDKDAIVAVMGLCEACAYYKSKGLSLWEQMINIYEKYGYYLETQHSIVLKGADGAEQIKQIMTKIRSNPPKEFGEYKVLRFDDYSNSTSLNIETKEVTPITLPKSNVLYFDLSDNAWCCARPSGTEPKIKFYFGVKGTSLEDAKQKNELLKTKVLECVN